MNTSNSQSQFGDRLDLALYKSKISQVKLASEIGLTQPAISKMKRGHVQETRKIIQIAKVLNVNPDWLISGSGEMYDSETVPDEFTGLEPWDKNTPLREDEAEVPFLKDIKFACGTGDISDEDYNGFKLRFSRATLRRVGANADGRGVLCFPVTGDSMEPVIPDGTTVAINTMDKNIIDGKIYAINEGGWKRLKILYRTGSNTISIRSYNKDEYKDEEKSLDEIEIIGRMFWYSVLM